MAGVLTCAITRSVLMGDPNADKVLKSYSNVSVGRNPILSAIMDVFDKWEQSPIVWIDNYAYKIKLMERGRTHATLCQMSVDVRYKQNGKVTYKPINKRMVKLTFGC